MALNYDFDMLSMTPKAILGGALPDAGAGWPQAETPVALFRDPATLAALSRAPQAVRDYLRASNFGINSYHSGAPAGRYPDEDDAARIEVIEALAQNVPRFDLPRADDNQPRPDEFHLPAFFAAVAEAEPIAMETVPTPDPVPSEPVEEITEFAAVDTLISAMLLDSDPRDATADPDASDSISAADAAPTADFTTERIIFELASAEDVAEAGTFSAPPPPRFRLPQVPRWLTAGAAFAVLGMGVGSALI